MKTKFKVEINGKGNSLETIIDAIANHNEGKGNLDLDIICSHLLFEKVRNPVLYKDIKISTEGENNQTIHISENDGKSYYLTVTECEYEELREEVPAPTIIFQN